MSNFFNTNSRFAALIDNNDGFIEVKTKKTVQTQDTKTKNIFTSDSSQQTEERKRGGQPRTKLTKEEDDIVREFEKRKHEKRVQESLKLENFPTLGSNKAKLDTVLKPDTGLKPDTVLKPDTSSFLETLRQPRGAVKKKNVEEEDEDMVNVRPGCIVLKRDPITRKTIIKGVIEEQPEINPSEEFRNVLNALTSLYIKRTQAYIEQNGYDVWEKMYRFPNYDYDYFNRMDEKLFLQQQEREDALREYDDTYYNN